MKKIFASIFIILVSFCFVLTGCSGVNIGMPDNYLQVTSNGGFVVGVGSTLYFGNAYKSYSALEDASDNNSEEVGAHSIKRVKVTNDAYVNLVKNDEDKVAYDNLINKISAYEASNMFVVGEYLYFTTPNIHKNDSKDDDKYNTYEFELSTLFKIKLDGTGLHEVYTTETQNAKFYLTGGENQSILVFDDSKLMQLKCYENANSLITLVEDATSTVFPSRQGEEVNKVYYTLEREEEDNFTGNIVNAYNLETNESEELAGYSNNGETITLVSYDGGRLFYVRKGVKNTPDALYSNDFSQGLSSQKLHKYEITGFDNGADLLVIENAEYDVAVFVFEFNNNIYMQDLSANLDTQAQKLTSESSEIVFADGTFVYYTTENGIYRVSVKTSLIQQISNVAPTNNDKVDFDGKYVYFYAQATDATTETEYLHRASISSAVAGSMQTECIAELLEEDVKEEETQE